MPPVRPTSTANVAPRVGENVNAVVKPTPTQEESDLVAAGVPIERHEWDGSPLQNIHGTAPPDRPEIPPGTLPPPVKAPTVTSLTPNTAIIGDADFTMTVNGSGFKSDSVIVWNGGDEPTTFVAEGQVTTIVKPSTASGPYTIPIAVRNGDKVSNEMSFSFTEAATRSKPQT
jgi:hypothetical protein